MEIPGNHYKILAITLARGGSKGIPNKNIININNKPLIYYTLKEAKKCKFINDYIVSTDSLKIKKIAEKYKVEVPFIRPKKYSSDNSSSVSALIHATKFMEKYKGYKYDYIIELMCTNPLKDVNDINAIIKKIITTKSESVIAMHRVYEHHPSRIKKIINDKIIDFIKEKNEARRQDLKPFAYIRSGAIYCMNRNYLIKKKRRYGGKNSRPYILEDFKGVNIDSENDLMTVINYLKKSETSKI